MIDYFRRLSITIPVVSYLIFGVYWVGHLKTGLGVIPTDSIDYWLLGLVYHIVAGGLLVFVFFIIWLVLNLILVDK